MHDPAEIAQNGGAAVAIGSAAVGYANQVMGWLNHNSAGILALCGVGGLIISVAGYFARRRHMREILEHELRMKERRGKRQ
jgi:hypothetical protein